MFSNKLRLPASLLSVALAASFLLCATSLTLAQKTVHVKTYSRKDGTVVAAHDRAAPRSKNTSSSSSSSTTPAPSTRASAPTYPTYSYPTYPVTTTSSSSASRARCVSCARDSNGRIKRSLSAKHAFMLTHPCPSTGSTSGRCQGYVIDHIKPLATGGADDPSNMQWQTIQEAKEKDKIERRP